MKFFQWIGLKKKKKIRKRNLYTLMSLILKGESSRLFIDLYIEFLTLYNKDKLP
jgi:hypothetical protein